LFFPITFEFIYKFDEKNDYFKFKILGIIIKSGKISRTIKNNIKKFLYYVEDVNISEFNIKSEIKKIIEKNVNIIFLINNIDFNLKMFKFNIEYGFKNPAKTGIINGVIWIVIGLYFAYLKDIKNNMTVNINPNFKQRKINIYLHGIFSLRLGNIILAGINLLYINYRGDIYGRRSNRKTSGYSNE